MAGWPSAASCTGGPSGHPGLTLSVHGERTWAQVLAAAYRPLSLFQPPPLVLPTLPTVPGRRHPGHQAGTCHSCSGGPLREGPRGPEHPLVVPAMEPGAFEVPFPTGSTEGLGPLGSDPVCPHGGRGAAHGPSTWKFLIREFFRLSIFDSLPDLLWERRFPLLASNRLLPLLRHRLGPVGSPCLPPCFPRCSHFGLFPSLPPRPRVPCPAAPPARSCRISQTRSNIIPLLLSSGSYSNH